MAVSRWTLTALCSLIAVLALTATSQAHTLKVSRAAKANKTFTKLACNAIDDEEARCVASRPGSCNRLSQHRVRCKFSLTLDLEDGSRSRCLALDEWYLRAKKTGMRVQYLGIKTCTELRPPTEEPAPEQ